MDRKDVRAALEALNADESVRERFEAGDFSAVDGLDLSPEECQLVQDAASDMPEVAGFAFDAFLKLDGVKGESGDHKHKDLVDVSSFLKGPVAWKTAVSYGWKL